MGRTGGGGGRTAPRIRKRKSLSPTPEAERGASLERSGCPSLSSACDVMTGIVR